MIAARVIAGSRNMNQMKADIEETFDLVRGLIPPCSMDCWEDGSQLVGFEWANLRWTVTKRSSRYESRYEVAIRDWSKGGGYVSVLAEGFRNVSGVRTEYLRQVREGVDIFLDKMVERFPSIEHRLNQITEFA
jgi:hypothetical protein